MLHLIMKRGRLALRKRCEYKQNDWGGQRYFRIFFNLFFIHL